MSAEGIVDQQEAHQVNSREDEQGKPAIIERNAKTIISISLPSLLNTRR